MAKKVKLAASLEVANTLTSNWTDHCTFYAGPGEDEKGEVVILGSSFTAGPDGVKFYKGSLNISPYKVSALGTTFSVGPGTVGIGSLYSFESTKFSALGTAFIVGPTKIDFFGSAFTMGPQGFQALDSALHVERGEVSILSEYTFGPSKLHLLRTVFVLGPDSVDFFNEVLNVNDSGALYKGKELATTNLVNLLLDCHMTLLEKETDVDLLSSSGQIAHMLNQEKYPYSHCTNYTELIDAEFTPTATVSGYFHSLKRVDDAPGTPVFGTSVLKWYASLPALVKCDRIFAKPILEFVGHLPSLVSAQGMFDGVGISAWTEDLPSLKVGKGMFKDCQYLESFSGSLQNLVNGDNMFKGSNLKDFHSSLSSLLSGVDMFDCELSLQGITQIAQSINNVNYITWDDAVALGLDTECGLVESGFKRIDINLDSTITEDKWVKSAQVIASKGWTAYINGTKYEPQPPTPVSGDSVLCEDGNSEVQIEES